MSRILIASSPTLAGYRVTKVLGLVRGNAVRARHIGKDLLALFRNVVGGDVPEYRKLMAESREQALDQMVDEARELGADAIISVRFSTSMIAGGMAEMLAYGTAVRTEPEAASSA